MIPVPGKTLSDIALRVATNLAADARSAYGQADGGMISALLLTLAEDFERAVFNRMTDIDEIKTLCARYPQAVDKLSDPTTAKAFADKTPTSLKLADVTALHAEAFELELPERAVHATVNLEAVGGQRVCVHAAVQLEPAVRVRDVLGIVVRVVPEQAEVRPAELRADLAKTEHIPAPELEGAGERILMSVETDDRAVDQRRELTLEAQREQGHHRRRRKDRIQARSEEMLLVGDDCQSLHGGFTETQRLRLDESFDPLSVFGAGADLIASGHFMKIKPAAACFVVSSQFG